MSQSNAPSEVLVALKSIVSARVTQWDECTTLDEPVVIGEHAIKALMDGGGLAAHLFVNTFQTRDVDGQVAMDMPVTIAVVGKIDVTAPATQGSAMLAMLTAWFDVYAAIRKAYQERATTPNALTPFRHLTLTAAPEIESGPYRDDHAYWAIGCTYRLGCRADPDTFAALKN